MRKPKDFDLLIERVESAEKWRDSVYKSKWKKYLFMYRSIAKDKPAGVSNMFIPQTFMMVETVKARVAGALFANRPFVTVLPRGSDDADKADLMESLLDWQLNERMQIKRVFANDLLSDAIIMGTSISYTSWLKKQRKQKKRMDVEEYLLDPYGMPFMDEAGQPILTANRQVVEENVDVYDDPITQHIDLFDFFVDRAATKIEDARFCGHVERLTKEQIKALEKTAGWSVNWKDLSPNEGMSSGRAARAEISGGGSIGSDDTYDKDSAAGLYEVIHYWEDNRHVVIINRQECALDEENPFWHGQKPYDKVCYITLPDEFYGMGLPESIADLQDELNTSRNMRIDYNAMALRRMWKMRKGCGITNKDLMWRQGGVIQLEDLDDVQEINIQQIPASAFTNEEITKQDMRYVTGVHDIIMGVSDADETATTTMTKDNNASIRFKFFIEALVDDMLIPIVDKCISMDIQYMDDAKTIRLFDNDAGKMAQIATITQEDIDGAYDLYYVGSAVEPMANKEMYKQKVLEAYTLAMNNPLVQQSPESQRNLLLALFKAAEIKNPEELLPPLPQPQMQTQPQSQATGVPPMTMGANQLALV